MVYNEKEGCYEREYYEVSFKYTTISNSGYLKGLLNLLKELGIVGASRSIGIKDPINIEEEARQYFFDGDGPDEIKDINFKKLTEEEYIK